MRGAAAMKKPDAKLFAESRKWLQKANKADVEDPEPLYQYYLSFLTEGAQPTKNAIAALHYASNLAPQDMNLRLMSATQHLRDKDLSQARKTLAPIAYNPHADFYATVARAMLSRVDAGDAEGALKSVEGEAKTDSAATGN